MKVEMVMPQMGESIAEGTILKWVKKVGDTVKKDENILEISTDKVDSEIPSPAGGRIVELRAQEGETVPVGQVIAVIETAAVEEVGTKAASPVAAVVAAAEPVREAPREPRPRQVAPPVNPPRVEGPVPREWEGRFFSPLVRAIARAEGIGVEELARIPGSGRGHRVTREDVLHYLESRSATPMEKAAVERTEPRPGAEAPPRRGIAFETYPKFTPSESRDSSDGRIDVVQMDNMRQRIAEHMVRSKATSAHVASVTECDVTKIVRHRESEKAAFRARHGFALTYTSYILQATVKALLDYPMMNASIEGTQVLVKRFINLGVAVALDNGLIVPVIRHAEEKSFLGFARALDDLSGRARAEQLKPDEIAGGTFTVTNMGSFGNLFGIPIINQPQVGILGAGAIVKRPVVITDPASGEHGIAIRDIMMLSLSYDHRVVDGALGGLFLERVRHYLEHPEVSGGL